MDAYSMPTQESSGDSLDDGWVFKHGYAEWWDGEDDPVLSLRLPDGVDHLSPETRALIEKAFWSGRERGVRAGEVGKQHEIRRVLGL